MTPPPDDDEKKYPPPQFIAQPGGKKPTPPKADAPVPPAPPAAPAEGPPVTRIDAAWDSDPTFPPDDLPATESPAATSPSAPYPTVVVNEWPTPPVKPLPGSGTSPLDPPKPSPLDPSSDASELPVLPSTYRENDLRAAIGIPAMPEQIKPVRRPPPPELDDDDDDGDGGPRRRKTILLMIGTAVAGVAIGATVIAGRINGDRYAIECRAKEVVAVQGRTFPPWGTSTLGGDDWKPIPIPASFQCAAVETEDVAAMHDAYRTMLLARADAMLTAPEVTEVDAAAAMLDQALLHARTDSKTDSDARRDIQRMQGDIGYWRASAQLRKAQGELADAAKQFEAASSKLPRHVSDSAAWAAHLRALVEQLKAGPSGSLALPPSAAPPTEPTSAPAGVALPVEPAAGSAAPATPPTPDAPPQSGGVLL